MNTKELASPCGIDCFNCEVYEDNITGKMREYLAGVYGRRSGKMGGRGKGNQGEVFQGQVCRGKRSGSLDFLN
ncbi:MAG: hypothetical protein CVU89_12275 [Firmicutes bacterium HGW-Firmicutes-14]|jgi:hypothetical protein|nr:MAG: hypothetical protein CVU89_12275 [Firmicutes bacterium HGW-Firmicutes-14]